MVCKVLYTGCTGSEIVGSYGRGVYNGCTGMFSEWGMQNNVHWMSVSMEWSCTGGLIQCVVACVRPGVYV